VLARLGRLDGQLRVAGRRRRDDHKVDGLVGQQGSVVVDHRRAGAVGLSRLAPHRGGIADHAELDAVQLGQPLAVRVGRHLAIPDDASAQRLHRSPFRSRLTVSARTQVLHQAWKLRAICA